MVGTSVGFDEGDKLGLAEGFTLNGDRVDGIRLGVIDGIIEGVNE